MPMERLTEVRCKTAKATSTRLEVRDKVVRGLEFRVTVSGIKSWSLLYTDRRTGKKRRLDLGRYGDAESDGVTLAVVRQVARKYIADIGDGADPARGVSMRRDAPTFQELAELRLAAMRPMKGGRKRRSLDNYRSMLRRHVYPQIGELKAIEIRKSDVKSMLAKVAETDDARFLKADTGRGRPRRKGQPQPGSLNPDRKVSHQPNRVFELVRSIFRWAVGEDLIDHDPMAGMKPPVEVDSARDRSLSEVELPSFWRALDAAPITRQLGLAMKLEIVTGQRTGELIRRLKTDIDRSGAVPVLLIPRDDTKNGRPHRVPLCPIAEALINESAALDQESDFIFPSSVRDASLTPESATKAMGRMRAKGTVTDLRVHDLRRTAANGMRRLGVPKFIVSVTLNHVSATRGDVTVQHYLDEYAFEVEKTDALLKWGAKLEEILIGAGIMSSRLSTPVNGGNLGDADTFSTGVLTIQTPSDTIGASAKVGTRKPADSLAATAAVIQNPIRPIEAASKDTRDYHAESDHRQGRRFARTRRLRSGPRAVWEPVSRRAPQGSEHVHGANDTATDDCTD